MKKTLFLSLITILAMVILCTPVFAGEDTMEDEDTVLLGDSAMIGNMAAAEDPIKVTMKVTGKYRQRDAYQFFQKLNEKRTAAGVPALQWDGNLEKQAMTYAGELTTDFTKDRPDGSARVLDASCVSNYYRTDSEYDWSDVFDWIYNKHKSRYLDCNIKSFAIGMYNDGFRFCCFEIRSTSDSSNTKCVGENYKKSLTITTLESRHNWEMSGWSTSESKESDGILYTYVGSDDADDYICPDSNSLAMVTSVYWEATPSGIAKVKNDKGYLTICGKKIGITTVKLALNKNSKWSDSTKVCVLPGPIQKVKVTAGKKSCTVKWKKYPGVSGYEIWRSKGNDGDEERVKVIQSGSKVSYKDKGLKSGKKYHYRVKGYVVLDQLKYTGRFSKSAGCKVK